MILGRAFSFRDPPFVKVLVKTPYIGDSEVIKLISQTSGDEFSPELTDNGYLFPKIRKDVYQILGQNSNLGIDYSPIN